MKADEPVALTLMIDPRIAAALLDKIVAAALPVSVQSVHSVAQMQAHAIRALEGELRDLGRELEETKRQLRETKNLLAFP